MSGKTHSVDELEALGDKELAETYRETFGECYPFEPTYYPVSFLYGGIEADPKFREKAIGALSSGMPLPRIDLQDDPEPGILY